MPFQMHFAQRARGCVAAGEVPIARIDDAARRDPRARSADSARARDVPRAVARLRGASRARARGGARKAIVLLQNERRRRCRSRGSRADRADRAARARSRTSAIAAPSDVRPAHVVTPLEGLRAALGAGGESTTTPATSRDAARARRALRRGAVVVVGYTPSRRGRVPHAARLRPFAHGSQPGPLRGCSRRASCGALGRAFGGHAARQPARGAPAGFARRGGDRRSLALSAGRRGADRAPSRRRTRARSSCVMAGSAVIMESWRQRSARDCCMLWYPGMEGGHALADVLFRRAAPSGRLPFVIPTDAAHLPYFDRDATRDHLRPLARLPQARPRRAEPGVPVRLRALVRGVRLRVRERRPQRGRRGRRSGRERDRAQRRSARRRRRWCSSTPSRSAPRSSARRASCAASRGSRCRRARRASRGSAARSVRSRTSTRRATTSRSEPIAYDLLAARHERDPRAAHADPRSRLRAAAARRAPPGIARAAGGSQARAPHGRRMRPRTRRPRSRTRWRARSAREATRADAAARTPAASASPCQSTASDSRAKVVRCAGAAPSNASAR